MAQFNSAGQMLNTYGEVATAEEIRANPSYYDPYNYQIWFDANLKSPYVYGASNRNSQGQLLNPDGSVWVIPFTPEWQGPFLYGTKTLNPNYRPTVTGTWDVSHQVPPWFEGSLADYIHLQEGLREIPPGSVIREGLTVSPTQQAIAAGAGVQVPTPVDSEPSVLDRLVSTFIGDGGSGTAPVSGLSAIPTWAWLAGGVAILYLFMGRNK